MITSAARPNRRNGFTLLEVLIALLVMSIGLLGIGKLVMLSARANDSAYLRTQATALAYSLMDAMRANRDAALAGNYNVGVVVNPGLVACNPCDGAQQAQNDLALWQGQPASGGPPAVLAQGVAGELPGPGQGTVTTAAILDPVTGATVTTATVTVTWNDQVAQQSFGGPAPPPNGSVTLETIL